MNRILLALFVAALALCASGCDQAGRADAPASASPTTRPAAPKSADKLLLLDDDEPEEGEELLADNSRCLVCHLNFEREELSLNHARAGVGCVKCHGESDAHIADESWASGGNGTAPDIMYLRDKINPGCLKCHKDNLDPVTHKSFLAGKTEQKQCTECHGKHKMVNRKCVWK
jgi:hypothetical protein